MESVNFLLDSNVVIDFLGGNLIQTGYKFVSDLVDQKPKISVITQIEVLGFEAGTEGTALLNGFIEEAMVYPLDNEVVAKTIFIRKKLKIRLPDAIIAATCLVHGCTLVTRNLTDFQKVPGLNLVNPHHP